MRTILRMTLEKTAILWVVLPDSYTIIQSCILFFKLNPSLSQAHSYIINFSFLFFFIFSSHSYKTRKLLNSTAPAHHDYQPDSGAEEQILPKPAPLFNGVKPPRPDYSLAHPPPPPKQKPYGVPKPIKLTPPEIHLLPYEQLPKDPKAYEQYLRGVFQEFMVKYKRDYINVPGEREYRFSLFADNYHAMNEFAVGDKMSAKYSVTEFSDLDDKEFSRIMGFDPNLLKGVKIDEEDTNKTLPISKEIPEHYDEREENYVTRVKLQGDCAACWAFTTVAVIEGLCARRVKKLQEFSEQSLIDCDTTNFGCKGGTEPNVNICLHVRVASSFLIENFPCLFIRQSNTL